jgi:hypothetical protein
MQALGEVSTIFVRVRDEEQFFEASMMLCPAKVESVVSAQVVRLRRLKLPPVPGDTSSHSLRLRNSCRP